MNFRYVLMILISGFLSSGCSLEAQLSDLKKYQPSQVISTPKENNFHAGETLITVEGTPGYSFTAQLYDFTEYQTTSSGYTIEGVFQ